MPEGTNDNLPRRLQSEVRNNPLGSTASVIAIGTFLIACFASLVAWVVTDDDTDRAVSRETTTSTTTTTETPGSTTVPEADVTTPTTTSPISATTSTSPVTLPKAAAELSVINHCYCFGPRSQGQLKVKPQIANTGETRLSLAPERFRLIVRAPLTGAWTPNEPAGELIELELGGTTVIGIPPNSDGAAEPLEGSSTFATHWSATELAPGESYVDPANRKGDLVFYVPLEGVTVLPLGLALLDPTHDVIVGFVVADDWQGLADANAF